ncbi:MAG: hypothetical protein ABSE08_19035 [Syntrophobacteraceae bacterium]|jgi:hypothetical protein
MKRIFLILTAIAMLSATAVPLMAQEVLPPDPNMSGRITSPPQGEFIMFDVFILRPLGLASMAVGAVSAAAAAPWAESSNSTNRVQRELIQKPYDYTFCRPVGDIDF